MKEEFSKEVNYDTLVKLVDPNETCDKDGELKHVEILQYMSKYKGYFIATVRHNNHVHGLEYVPTDGDHPILGPDEERERADGYEDLTVADHLVEFVQLFKNAAYTLEVAAELGGIYKLRVSW